MGGWGATKAQAVCFLAAKDEKSISGYLYKRLKVGNCYRKNWQLQLEAFLTHSPKQVSQANQLLTIFFWWVTMGRQLVKSRKGDYSWFTPYIYLSKDPTYHPCTRTIFILINEPRRDANWSYFCCPGLIRWPEASVQQDNTCSFSRLIVMEVSISLPPRSVELLQTTIYLKDFGF